MPHIWKREDSANEYSWVAESLSKDPLHVRLRADLATIEVTCIAEPLSAHATLLRTDGGERGERWALLAGESGVRVNGRAPLGGVALLRDRDEISLAGGLRAYFSTEVLPVVEPYPHDESVRCPRCSTPIESGMLAVRCPSCGVWQHQGERRCFTYADTCGMCPRPTQLDGGFQWTPELLDGSAS